jgi:ssDNA-binding Zn-finger/Zn-ribbon topoisomerase 1
MDQPTSEATPECPKCGDGMLLRHGRNGEFYGCVQYPQCRGTRQVERSPVQRNEAVPAQPLPSPGYTDEEDERVSDGWSIATLADADWALKRLGDLKAEIASHQEIHERNVARLKLRLEHLVAKAERGVAFFEGQLKAFAESNKDKLLTGRKKSRELQHGVLGFRAPRGGLQLTDPDKFVRWAEENKLEQLLRKTLAPAMAEVQKFHTETGMVPPGTEVKPTTEDKFYAEPTIGGRAH